MKHGSSPDCGKVYFIQPYVIKVISDLRKIDGLPSVSAVNPHKNTKIYLGNWYKTDLILLLDQIILFRTKNK